MQALTNIIFIDLHLKMLANLYVFKWYFLSLIMWGALARMALRRILPARRIFSEGTCAVKFGSDLRMLVFLPHNQVMTGPNI